MAIAHAVRASICGAVFLLLAGCSRKAPGPDACFALSLRTLGIQDRRVLDDPRVKAEVDALTDKCLTTPFDRQLTQCVRGPSDVPFCFSEFQRRYALRAGPSSP
jgi:hypothetical protein